MYERASKHVDTLHARTYQTKVGLRVQIVAVDVDLINLLVTRSRYIDRTVDLKKIESLPARTPDRVAEVLDKVGSTASEMGLDTVLARTLWTKLIEWSIQREIKTQGE